MSQSRTPPPALRVVSSLPPVPRVSALLTLAEEAFSANTKRAIRADTDDWVRWCLARGVDAVPAAPEMLCAYLEDLAGRSDPRTGRPLAYATLARRLSSLAWLHRASQAADPTKDPAVRLKLKALARRKGRRQAQAQGITRPELDQMLAALADGLAEDLRDAAMLSIAYDAMLRRSELVSIRLHQVTTEADGSGLLYLPRSKTDQEGEGVYCWLAPDTMNRLAAWRAVRDLLLARAQDAIRRALDRLVRGRNAGTIANSQRQRHILLRRQDRLAEATDHLWLHFDRSGLPAGGLAVAGPDPGRRVSEIFKRRAEAAGLDPARISGHSLRVGAAQDLTAAGFGLPAIQQAGRWKSPTMPARYGERIVPRQGAMAKLAERQGRKGGGNDSV